MSIFGRFLDSERVDAAAVEPPHELTSSRESEFLKFKDPPAKAAPLRNEKGVSSQSFWYL